MKTNLGSYDVAVRFVLGCILAGAGFQHHSWWGLAGVVLLTSAITGCCPLYVPLRINTTWMDRPKADGPK